MQIHRPPSFLQGIICQGCGKPAVKSSATQKYCKACARPQQMQRQKDWQQKHPKSVGSPKKREITRQLSAVERGAGLNKKERLGILSWYYEPDLVWLHRVAIPFSWSGSKNHIYARGRKAVYLREGARAFRTQLATMIKASIRNNPIVQNKVWIDILVQKPNQKGDAINFLDLICDAVKDAIGVDDRWYCIRRLDWQIVKNDPKIFVGIGQEAVEASQVCSHCGRILPLASFWKCPSSPRGHSGACKECLTKKRQVQRVTQGLDGSSDSHKIVAVRPTGGEVS